MTANRSCLVFSFENCHYRALRDARHEQRAMTQGLNRMAEIRAEVRFASLGFKSHGTNQAHGMTKAHVLSCARRRCPDANAAPSQLYPCRGHDPGPQPSHSTYFDHARSRSYPLNNLNFQACRSTGRHGILGSVLRGISCPFDPSRRPLLPVWRPHLNANGRPQCQALPMERYAAL